MRRLWLEMQAGLGASEQVQIWLLCWGCCALAVSIAHLAGFVRTGAAAAAFCVPCLALAGVLAGGARSFVRDAETLLLPGMRTHSHRMRRIASALTALPVAVALWVVASSDAWQAWTPALLSLAVVLASMIVPIRSLRALALLIAGPVLGLGIWQSIEGPPGSGGVGSTVTCAVLAFGVAMQWCRLQRRGPQDRRPDRLQSLLSRALPPHWRLRAIRARAAEAASAARGRPIPPAIPIEIVRVLLGAPFTLHRWWPPSAPGIVLVFVMLIFFLITGVALPMLGHSLREPAPWNASIGAAVLLSVLWLWQTYAKRIASLRRASTGDVVELALLPGLDGAGTQRRALLRAALMPPLAWLGFFFLLGTVALAWEGAPPRADGVLALFLFGSWMTYAARVVQTFSIPRAPANGFVVELLLYYFCVYTPIASHGPLASDFPASWHWWIWAGPLLFMAAVTFTIAFSYRKLLLAPHPFLVS